MVYSGSNQRISYATSNSPTGPRNFKGYIFGNPNIGTNHAGVVDYKGRSYMFYHNGALPGGGSFKRWSVEEFTYGPDGSIPSLTMTKQGPAPVGTLDPYKRVEAETTPTQEGSRPRIVTTSAAASILHPSITGTHSRSGRSISRMVPSHLRHGFLHRE